MENGKSMEITPTGHGKIKVGNGYLELKNVLLVLEIKKNVISVCQLTSDSLVDFLLITVLKSSTGIQRKW